MSEETPEEEKAEAPEEYIEAVEVEAEKEEEEKQLRSTYLRRLKRRYLQAR
ncbi:MAG: hypothetical protein J7L12_02990 [Desulfurococcales archaeon]|nr:hypothetical protein [Desulfurococcales archaeon]